MKLAQKLGLKYVSGSSIRSEVLGISDVTARDAQFWRRDGNALDILRLKGNDHRDTAVDEELIAMARREEDCVFDVWVMPWLFQEESLCIYLNSSLDTRARRLSHSSQPIDSSQAVRGVTQKDQCSRDFFLTAYNVDIFRDMSPFDIIVDCDESNEEAAACISTISEHLTAIVRLVRSGDLAELRRFAIIVNDPSQTVKTVITSRLFERVSDRLAV
jgi:cytidylate kinase